MSNNKRYAGMTVNERLFDTDLLETFDAAARAGDRAAMIRILADVDVEDAAATADTILKSPEHYGY
jgi:hypothetical protein